MAGAFLIPLTTIKSDVVSVSFQPCPPPHTLPSLLQMDLNYMAKHKSEDVYASFNLLMRRKPKVRPQGAGPLLAAAPSLLDGGIAASFGFRIKDSECLWQSGPALRWERLLCGLISHHIQVNQFVSPHVHVD